MNCRAFPGLAEGWGETVLHCPYCHGYEVRGQRLGIVGTRPRCPTIRRCCSPSSATTSPSSDTTLPNPMTTRSRMLDSLGIEYIDAHIAEVDRTEEGAVLAPSLSLKRRTADTAAQSSQSLTFDALDRQCGYARANSELFTQLGGNRGRSSQRNGQLHPHPHGGSDRCARSLGSRQQRRRLGDGRGERRERRPRRRASQRRPHYEFDRLIRQQNQSGRSVASTNRPDSVQRNRSPRALPRKHQRFQGADSAHQLSAPTQRFQRADSARRDALSEPPSRTAREPGHRG
jgi:hypothetical protein